MERPWWWAVLSMTCQPCFATAGGPACALGGREPKMDGEKNRKRELQGLSSACRHDSDIRYQHTGLILKENTADTPPPTDLHSAVISSRTGTEKNRMFCGVLLSLDIMSLMSLRSCCCSLRHRLIPCQANGGMNGDHNSQMAMN